MTAHGQVGEPKWSPPSRYPQRFWRQVTPSQSPGPGAPLKLGILRAAFAPPAPRPQPCYPTSSLLCSPPTPLLPRPWLWIPSPQSTQEGERFFDLPPACVRKRRGRRRLYGSGPPRTPISLPGTARGLPGYWIVLFRRAAVSHPASGEATSPTDGDLPFRLQSWQTPGLPGKTHFGAVSRGSPVRLPTHQPNHYWNSCKASYRPAGLGFNRAGFAPAGRQTEFREIVT